MNCTLYGNSPKLPSYLKFALSKLLKRSTSKIAVEVEGDLLEKLENDEIKPRHHPGIVKANRYQLPTKISNALKLVIGDYPVKALLKDCQRLSQYINARHPPPEQDELRVRLRNIVEEIDERMAPERGTFLTEADEAKWDQKRENAIKRRLVQRTYAWKPLTYGTYETVVYAIGRGAYEYGVLMRILHELETRDKEFQPRSFFDFGSGVGTGMWAASTYWQNSIFEYFNVDSSREMHDLSELVLREGHDNQQMTLRNVFYRQFLPADTTKYDLVVSAFSLFELPSAQARKDTLLNLWRKCDGYLILAEEGTRKGSELVNEAREYILGLRDEDLKGHVFAPCAHDLACPRLADVNDRTPCNFEVSYAPLRVGNNHASHLTARFSYVVLKKGTPRDPSRTWPRLVRPTLLRSKHTICRMCTADAKLQEVIFTQAKHGRVAYRCAKASRWGDRLPIAVGQPFSESETEIAESSEGEEDESEHKIEGDPKPKTETVV